MAYTCNLNSVLGLPGIDYTSTPLLFTNTNGLVGIRGSTGNRTRYFINSSLIGPAIEAATGRSSVQVLSINIGQSTRVPTGIYRDGTTGPFALNGAVPLVDYYYTLTHFHWQYSYLHTTPNGSLRLFSSYAINLSEPAQVRTVNDIYALFRAGGLNVSDITYQEDPQIVCINDADNTSTTVNVSGSFTMPTSVTSITLDGDPPYLAHVSATEPDNRGQGDMWFNPITGHLSVWTNGE